MIERLLSLGLAVSLCVACGPENTNEGGVLQLAGPDMAQDATDAAVVDVALPVDASSTSVQATVRIVNPATGQGFSGVMVTGPSDTATTDGSGRATVGVDPGAYQISLAAPGARVHRVWGVAGEADFEQITYVSPDMITGFVFGSLGLTDDTTKGILVVGLDTPTLAPAVGAEADIDGVHGTPFVFAGSRPAAGKVIPMGGQGFVTFPNVDPGMVNITTNYPDGTCAVFPAETDHDSVEIIGGEVTVIAFTCRSDP